MKKLSLLLVLLLASVSLQAQQLASANATAKPASTDKPALAAVLRWEVMQHNFGEVPQGTPVSTTFYFTNSSQEPLLVEQVKGSCGCTVTTYSKEAIAPGDRGFVTATYNAAHPGVFRKTVSVNVSGQAREMVLTLQGTVLAAE